MKTLTEKFKEIMDSPHIASGKIGHEAVIIQLIQAVKERDAYVSNQARTDLYDDETTTWENCDDVIDEYIDKLNKRAEDTL